MQVQVRSEYPEPENTAFAMKFSEIINDQQLATEAIRRWVTVAICIVVSLVVADWIASQQFFFLALLAGVAVLAFVTIGMQRSAWLLIIIGWSFQGEIHALPVPLATRDLIVLVVTFSYFAQRVFGQTARRSTGTLGVLVLINCGWLALTFVCHPVGMHSLGAETMGARPYFLTFISFCAYWVIVHLPESYKSVTRIPLWLLASMTFTTLISVIVYIYPSATPYVWFFYSSVDVSGYLGSLRAKGTETEIHRLTAFAPFGLMLIQLLSAYYPPRKLLNPLRWQFYLSLLGLAAILASGFRSGLAFALGCAALAAWFHRGWREVIFGG